MSYFAARNVYLSWSNVFFNSYNPVEVALCLCSMLDFRIWRRSSCAKFVNTSAHISHGTTLLEHSTWALKYIIQYSAFTFFGLPLMPSTFITQFHVSSARFRSAGPLFDIIDKTFMKPQLVTVNNGQHGKISFIRLVIMYSFFLGT